MHISVFSMSCRSARDSPLQVMVIARHSSCRQMVSSCGLNIRIRLAHRFLVSMMSCDGLAISYKIWKQARSSRIEVDTAFHTLPQHPAILLLDSTRYRNTSISTGARACWAERRAHNHGMAAQHYRFPRIHCNNTTCWQRWYESAPIDRVSRNSGANSFLARRCIYRKPRPSRGCADFRAFRLSSITYQRQ